MGMVRSITGLILPSLYHCASSARAAALAFGSCLANPPQNTPTMEAPLSSVRFNGNDGMGPEANPTTR